MVLSKYEYEYEHEHEFRCMRRSLMNSHQQSWWFTELSQIESNRPTLKLFQ
jgi:hypothetical protein